MGDDLLSLIIIFSNSQLFITLIFYSPTITKLLWLYISSLEGRKKISVALKSGFPRAEIPTPKFLTF